jgi:hypothetical protein
MSNSIQRLYKHVEFLSTIRPARNYENKCSIDKTIEYIDKELYSYGYHVTKQTFSSNLCEYQHTNISVLYGNEKLKRLVVGAHYDVCCDTPGADDNASAIAGLLENARELIAKSPKLEYCVEFVAYANEEPPFFGTKYMGSHVHAEGLFKNKIDVIGMVCYEMIGYFSDEMNSQDIPYEFKKILNHSKAIKLASRLPMRVFRLLLDKFNLDDSTRKIFIDNKKYLYEIIDSFNLPNKGDFIIILGKPTQQQFISNIFGNMSPASKVHVQKVLLPSEVGLAKMSDHMNYWKFGYNAVMINDTSFLRNPNYHELTDTIDTLDFNKMDQVVKGVFTSICNLQF